MKTFSLILICNIVSYSHFLSVLNQFKLAKIKWFLSVEDRVVF